MKTRALIAATFGLTFLLAACSNDETDYKENAQAFIMSDTVENAIGLTFTNASCNEPPSTDVGSKFQCTALGSDGVIYVFDLEIKAKDYYELVDYNPQG